jgi:hypothetical protein
MNSQLLNASMHFKHLLNICPLSILRFLGVRQYQRVSVGTDWRIVGMQLIR